MSARDPAILELEIAAKGWHILLTYDGLPAQEDIDKIKEEKSESLKARPADLSYKLGSAPDKKLSPQAEARAQRIANLNPNWTIDARSTRLEWWSLQITKNESLSSLFDRFDKIKAQLADDGIDISDAELRSSVMDSVAYYITGGPHGIAYNASPFMRAVASIRDEENLLKAPFSYPALRSRLLAYEADHRPQGSSYGHPPAHANMLSSPLRADHDDRAEKELIRRCFRHII